MVIETLVPAATATSSSSKEIDMPDTQLPEGVVRNDHGQDVAPIGLLVPYHSNPRSHRDFDEEEPRFKSLVDSIDEIGVREPIQVFVQDGKLAMITGHRRRKAVLKINERRETARKVKLSRGETLEDEKDAIETIPIVMFPVPESDFNRQADMWASESLHSNWNTSELVAFFKKTYELALKELKEEPDTKWLSQRLGLPKPKTKLMKTIVQSEVLTNAAVLEDSVLPSKGREKNLRSINRCAEVIQKFRAQGLVVKITGESTAGYKQLEKLRELMIGKAVEYQEDRKIPAGVALERTATGLRDDSEVDDDTLLAWITGKGVICEERLPTTVGSAKQLVTAKAGVPFLESVKTYTSGKYSSASTDQLKIHANEVQQAIDTLEAHWTSLRKELRNR
jgi:hypothetical protein